MISLLNFNDNRLINLTFQYVSNRETMEFVDKCHFFKRKNIKQRVNINCMDTDKSNKIYFCCI